MWNDLVKLMNITNNSVGSRYDKIRARKSKIKDTANMYLHQLNAAGGKDMIGAEIQRFIDANKSYL